MTFSINRMLSPFNKLTQHIQDRLNAEERKAAIPSEAVAYLPPLDAIVEEPPPRSMQRTQWMVAAFMTVSLLAAIIGQVDIVVRGTGRLATTAPPITLMPLERSVLRELRVKPGERVTAGQVLATLDPTFAQADVAQLSARQRSLLAQLQRMEAELAGQPFDAGDGSDPERRLQASLYAQRKADFSARMAAFEEDIRRQEASIRSAQSEADGLKQQLAVVHEVVNMRETLLHSQTGSKLNALDAQNLSIRTQREYNAAINKQTESRFAVASRQAEQRSFAEQWRRETMEKLVAARDEAAKVNEDLVKASRMRDLVQLVAPADAVVVEIAKRSLGSVLREAEPLITLVAASSPLMAEIDLASADIGYAQPGDPVQIKIDAFPYQRHGMIEGRLTNIAMESVSPDGQGGRASGGPQIHHGQVELTSLKLDNLPDGIAPIPGMTINAEIKVGTRSVMSYFLYPVIRGLGESIREP